MASNRTPSLHQESPEAAQRRRLIEKRNEDAEAAVTANGGRSAPHSAAETASALTPEGEWLKMFPMPPGASNPAPIALGTPGTLNPFVPHAGVPAINNPRPQTSPSLVHPQTAPNYLGESTYFDPHAGVEGAQVHEIDPAKDQRFSVMGQTSGANTAAGIAKMYGDPTGGSIRYVQPTAPTTPPAPAYDQAAARASTLQAHPNIGVEGTPENNAFVAHATQYGEQSAHANLPSILSQSQTMSAAKPPAAPKEASTSEPLSPYS